MKKAKAKPSIETSHSLGRKRRFGLAGILNVLATNILLQLLLKKQFLSTGLATLISQLLNGCLGYAIYGGWVFRSREMHRMRSGVLYAAMMALLWGFNTVGIHVLTGTGVLGNRNVVALIMVVPLAVVSYLLQKHVIFRSTLRTQ